MRLPLPVVLLPAIEGAREPRSHLGIQAVEGDDLLGHPAVAAAVGGVEVQGILRAEVNRPLRDGGTRPQVPNCRSHADGEDAGVGRGEEGVILGIAGRNRQ